MRKKNIVVHSKKRKSPGLPPGTLIYTGQQKAEKVSFYLIQYHENLFNETYITENDPLIRQMPPDKTTWINVEGLHDIEKISTFCSIFKLNNLLVEDILNVNQIPKIDDYSDDGVLFLTLNEFFFIDKSLQLGSDQISLIIGKNYVITFQEKAGDVFEPIRERLKTGKGKMRKNNADYLAYALFDALVDSYYLILDKYSEELLFIESEIIETPKGNQLNKIHLLTKNLILLRKAIAPQKEIINKLIKEDFELILPSSKIFFRDLLDHVNQILISIDTDREFLTNLINANMTNINNRMNEIVKVLTLISTIFIPLTFIVGVYGMNFENLPELTWHYGYYILWGIMIFIVLVQIYIFKKNKWL